MDEKTLPQSPLIAMRKRCRGKARYSGSIFFVKNPSALSSTRLIQFLRGTLVCITGREVSDTATGETHGMGRTYQIPLSCAKTGMLISKIHTKRSDKAICFFSQFIRKSLQRYDKISKYPNKIPYFFCISEKKVVILQPQTIKLFFDHEK